MRQTAECTLWLGAEDEEMLWWNSRRLKAVNPKVRARAIASLGRSLHPTALQLLLASLQDRDSSIRAIAAANLARSRVQGRDQLVRDALAHSLRDQDAEVRVAAVRSLGELGWKPASRTDLALCAVASRHWEGLATLGTEGLAWIIHE